MITNGRDVSVVGRTITSPLPTVRNAENVLIENNTFQNGNGYAILLDPCSVKNVIIRNNTFTNWTNDRPIVFIGWQAKHSECTANIRIEGNRWNSISGTNYAIGIKTSGVLLQNNSGAGAVEQRHGRNNRYINNNFSGTYFVLGDTHYFSGNRGGDIRLLNGNITQDDMCTAQAYSGTFPVARDITVEGNQSNVVQGSWEGNLQPTCNGSDCPANLRN